MKIVNFLPQELAVLETKVLPNLDKMNLDIKLQQKVNNIYFKLEKEVETLLTQYNTPGSLLNIDLAKLIVREYLSLKSIFKLKGEQNFQSFLSKFETPNEEIEKEAHNILSRWLKRRKLKGSKDQIRFSTVVSLKEAIDKIDPLLDKLEDPQSSATGINEAIKAFNKNLIETYIRLKALIEKYYFSQDLITKTRTIHKMDKTRRDDFIRSINKIILDLNVNQDV